MARRKDRGTGPKPPSSTSQLELPPNALKALRLAQADSLRASRKQERRRARIIIQSAPTSTSPPITTSSSSAAAAAAATPSLPMRLPALPPRPPISPNADRLSLLICSIGNPGPTYAHTLHSAAHVALASLASALNIGPWAPDPRYEGSAGGPEATANLVAVGAGASGDAGHPPWTLWKSGSLMNVSGKGVKRAWNAFSSGPGAIAGGGRVMVVMHDELEARLGKVTVRWGGSARGHNGLKSIQSALPKTRFATLGIGIGRPASREPAAVSRYVLRKMTREERSAIERAGVEAIEVLRDIEEGKDGRGRNR